ncbi:acylphosphatase [Nitrincola nitratireducens]|uniref:Acylphosphatase n=1 Tax=Nitrincola nitratireducens TaxID=1229521 RepID=W9V0V6_9GAMM|nr:acylphosphatase [Nitrincola nitratireducens]EXJ12954.1 Acylphosphatase [Nitrincola nitratireducens]
MSKLCLHLIISGRVQGVWFRRFTQEHAQLNNVTGWVKNLPDGSVEALLCGDEQNVRHVETWLSKGPELANVADIQAQQQAMDESFTCFEIR